MDHALRHILWQAVSGTFGEELLLGGPEKARRVRGIFEQHPLSVDLATGTQVLSENPRATIPLTESMNIEAGDALEINERTYEVVNINVDFTRGIAQLELHATRH
jgi:hypothetical protein